MKLCFNQLLFAFSYALDCIERDYFQSTSFHGKRVAYMSLLLGEYLKMNDKEINDLIGCAILHDNGLTEYYKQGDRHSEEEMLKAHCVTGETNMIYIPFFDNVQDVILYHHEMANGKGPFGKKEQEIPLFSQIIHIADYTDLNYNLRKMNQKQYDQMIQDLQKQIGIHFTKEIVDTFTQALPYEVLCIDQYTMNQYLKNNRHNIYRELDNVQLLSICQLFAHIIDSKSPHTRTHSIGVATKATQMAIYYGCDEDMTMKIFFAGALHDVGKLVIQRDILEKPAKLTDREYTYMQTHAYYTFKILSDMDLGDIIHWSSFHHEKLDGSGYPFGKTADELDFYDRLMACCDIYQALTEKRPYKEALSHQKSIEIMRNMVSMNKIDGQIVEDMNKIFSDYGNEKVVMTK
ncbi:MAG: HD-GYP domain-containing protein [Longibaculum sp.]